MEPEQSHLHPEQQIRRDLPRPVVPCDPAQATSSLLICSAGESSLEFGIKVLQLLLQYDGKAVTVEFRSQG